jgi:hypothetical protein
VQREKEYSEQGAGQGRAGYGRAKGRAGQKKCPVTVSDPEAIIEIFEKRFTQQELDLLSSLGNYIYSCLLLKYIKSVS